MKTLLAFAFALTFTSTAIAVPPPPEIIHGADVLIVSNPLDPGINPPDTDIPVEVVEDIIKELVTGITPWWTSEDQILNLPLVKINEHFYVDMKLHVNPQTGNWLFISGTPVDPDLCLGFPPYEFEYCYLIHPEIQPIVVVPGE